MQIVAAIPKSLKRRSVRNEGKAGAVFLGEIVKTRTEQLPLNGGLVTKTTRVGDIQQRHHFVRTHKLSFDPLNKTLRRRVEEER